MAALNTAPEGPAAPEKIARGFDRQSVAGGDCPAITLFLGEVPYPARAEDLSVAGAGLVLGGPVREATVVTIRLANPSSGFSCSRQAEIAHATELPGGRFLVGCRFLKSLSEEELVALAQS